MAQQGSADRDGLDDTTTTRGKRPSSTATPVVLGDPDSAFVRFSDPQRPFRGEPMVAVLGEVGGPGFQARSSVLTYEGEGRSLASFLAGLAEAWKGWDGVRKWEGFEDDLRIEASTDPLGHVVMRFTLRQDFRPTAWEASVVISVEAGEEMSRFARDMADLLAAAP